MMLWNLFLCTSFAGVTWGKQSQCTTKKGSGASLVQRANFPFDISDKVNVDFGGSDNLDEAPMKAANETGPLHMKVATAVRPTLVITEQFNSVLGAWQSCASDAGKHSDCFQGFRMPQRGRVTIAREAIVGNIRRNSDVSKIALEMHVNCKGTENSVFLFHLKRMKNAIVELWFDLKKIHEFTTDKRDGADVKVEIPISPNKINTARVEVKPVNPRKAAGVAIDLNAWMVEHSFLDCMEGKAATDDCLQLINISSAEAKILRNDQAHQKSCLEGTSSNSFCDPWKSCLSANKQAHLLNVLKATMAPSVSLPASQGLDADDHADCISPANVDPESWDCDCADSANAACDDMNMQRDDQCYKLLLCQSEKVCASWKTGAGCSVSESTALLALQDRKQKREHELERALDDSTRSKGCGDRR